jgi:hypothetical protein
MFGRGENMRWNMSLYQFELSSWRLIIFKNSLFPDSTFHLAHKTDIENPHSFATMQLINIAMALTLPSIVCGAAIPASPVGEIEGSMGTLPIIGGLFKSDM